MTRPERKLAAQGPAPLLLLADGAMSRGELDKLYRRHAPKQAPPPAQLPRHRVVGAVIGHALSRAKAEDHQPLQAIAEALSRRSRTEAKLLAATSPEAVEAKLTTYGGMSFRRQRARMIWAALCDPRPTVVEAGERMLARITEAAAAGDETVRLPQAQSRGPKPALPQLQGDDSAQLGKLRRALKKRDAQLALTQADLDELRLAAARDRGEQRRDLAAAEQDKKQITELTKALAEAQTEAARQARAVAQAEAEALDLAQRLASQAKELAARTEERDARPEAAAYDALLAAQKAWGQERALLLERQHQTSEALGVVVLFDAANIGAGARQAGGLIDFAGLLQRLLRGRPLRQAIAFAVAEPGDDRQRFESALRGAGIATRWRRPQRFSDGTVKADWDVGLTIEALRWAERAEVVIIASGDGDFLPLVDALRGKGCCLEAAAWPERCNTEWRQAVAQFYPLDGGDLL